MNWYSDTPAEGSPAEQSAAKKTADRAAMWTPKAQERHGLITKLGDAAKGTLRAELGYLETYKQAAEELSRKAN